MNYLIYIYIYKYIRYNEIEYLREKCLKMEVEEFDKYFKNICHKPVHCDYINFKRK